jgi:hypothetical protein
VSRCLTCPWSQRVAIVRELKGLQDAVGISYAHPFRDERGWAFPGGEFADDVNGWSLLREGYVATDPGFEGRVTRASPRRRGAYEEAFDGLFARLEELEALLGTRRYLAGDRITEADWRLWVTLLRFDAVYFVHSAATGGGWSTTRTSGPTPASSSSSRVEATVSGSRSGSTTHGPRHAQPEADRPRGTLAGLERTPRRGQTPHEKTMKGSDPVEGGRGFAG